MKQPVSENLNDASNDFPIPFALIPWGQHIEIITRSESLEEALFYMQHVIEKGLSRTALVNCYKAHLFDHQGKIVNNFSTYLPEPQSHLVPFEPEFTGKLNYYVSAVDELVKTPDDNPTIGPYYIVHSS